MDRTGESRRSWLRVAWLLGMGLPLGLRGRQVHAAPADEPIAQPATPSPQAFIDRAFDMRRRAEAQGDQAFGAVVVHDGKIVGQAPSAVVSRGDPTAHAEIEAIRDAARRLGRRNLGGCTLYSSFRPCAMCEAAAYWAGIDRMVHGTGLSDAGAPRLGRC
jgi:tRNA(Arg) A34 adenosine deaminase TadA